MNIHIYDGQVDFNNYLYLDIPELNDDIKNFSTHICWQTIIKDWRQDANYDNIHKIRVEPLCKLIVDKLPVTLKDIFEEQLSDMTTGMCPQGRAVRLVQILNSL